MIMNNYCAIIVAYNPDVILEKIIRSLNSQHCHIILINNSEEDISTVSPSLSVDIINNKKNIGIAAAQNLGIDFAMKKKFKFIFFLDQDTVISKNFCSSMISSFNQISSIDNSIGCLVPNYINKQTKEQAKFLVVEENDYKLKSVYNQKNFKISNAISSGMLVKGDVFRNIKMRDDFFIDQVDTAFCIDLFKKGFSIYVTGKNELIHSIGKTTKHSLFGKKVKTNNHNDTRKFFFIRNSIRLLKENDFNKGFKKYIFHQIVYTITVTLLFEENKRKKVIAILNGIRCGIFVK